MELALKTIILLDSTCSNASFHTIIFSIVLIFEVLNGARMRI
jgi:hypothetical protein